MESLCHNFVAAYVCPYQDGYMEGKLRIETPAERKLWREVHRAWLRSGHGASRFEIARQYTRKYPNNVWGWVALGDILTDLAHYDAAHHALSQAQQLAPKIVWPRIYLYWADLYRKRGDLKRAESFYRRAVKAKATTSRLVLLGCVLARQGRLSEAKACHRRAVRLATCPPDEAYFNLGLILRAERRYAKALDCFERAIQIDRDYTFAKEARKDVLHAMKLRKPGGPTNSNKQKRLARK